MDNVQICDNYVLRLLVIPQSFLFMYLVLN
jgi:hypothetical protein